MLHFVVVSPRKEKKKKKKRNINNDLAVLPSHNMTCFQILVDIVVKVGPPKLSKDLGMSGEYALVAKIIMGLP